MKGIRKRAFQKRSFAKQVESLERRNQSPRLGTPFLLKRLLRLTMTTRPMDAAAT